MPWLQAKTARVAHRFTYNSGFMRGLASSPCGRIYAIEDFRLEHNGKKCRRCRKYSSKYPVQEGR